MTKDDGGPAFPLAVKRTTVPMQYQIENDWMRLTGPFADTYVSFGGYFGSYGPSVFAAAPEMRDALSKIVEARMPGEARRIARAALQRADAMIAEGKNDE